MFHGHVVRWTDTAAAMARRKQREGPRRAGRRAGAGRLLLKEGRGGGRGTHHCAGPRRPGLEWVFVCAAAFHVLGDLGIGAGLLRKVPGERRDGPQRRQFERAARWPQRRQQLRPGRQQEAVNLSRKVHCVAFQDLQSAATPHRKAHSLVDGEGQHAERLALELLAQRGDPLVVRLGRAS